MTEADILVAGGGLLGSAFAYGLALRGARVTLLDEGDDAIRTARGNFGLVWVQSKGLGMRPYARWTLHASRRWPELSARLLEETGIDTGYQHRGGFNVTLDEDELAAHVARLEQLRREAGDEGYDYEVVEHAELERRLPGIGPTVPAATYCPHDGHCNPLRLLRALHAGFQRAGGRYLPRSHVDSIEHLAGGGFRASARDGAWTGEAAKVVLAAGHGAPALGRALGIDVPVHPEQGQVLVTERCAPRMDYPTNYVRQTDEGGFLLGPSSRDAGFDLDTENATLSTIAERCGRAFPFVRNLRVQRTWAALRVMTPDGCPVYQHSTTAPGAFSFACHSGVTLASAHALEVPDWVLAGEIPQAYRCFDTRRFGAQGVPGAPPGCIGQQVDRDQEGFDVQASSGTR